MDQESSPRRAKNLFLIALAIAALLGLGYAAIQGTMHSHEGGDAHAH